MAPYWIAIAVLFLLLTQAGRFATVFINRDGPVRTTQAQVDRKYTWLTCSWMVLMTVSILIMAYAIDQGGF